MNYNQKYEKFYHTKEWKSLRNYKFKEANGCCEKCLKKGKIVPGIQVHHKIPIEDDWSKRFDLDNLELLCIDCHNEEHDRISPLQKFESFWEDLEKIDEEKKKEEEKNGR